MVRWLLPYMPSLVFHESLGIRSFSAIWIVAVLKLLAIVVDTHFGKPTAFPFRSCTWLSNSKRSSTPGAFLNYVSACGSTMGDSITGQEYCACGLGSPWARDEETLLPPSQIIRHPFVWFEGAKRPMVHRLQGWVYAWQSPVPLSPNSDRLCKPLPDLLWRPREYAGGASHHVLWATV